jgi:hypothetical protein
MMKVDISEASATMQSGSSTQSFIVILRVEVSLRKYLHVSRYHQREVTDRILQKSYHGRFPSDFAMHHPKSGGQWVLYVSRSRFDGHNIVAY